MSSLDVNVVAAMDVDVSHCVGKKSKGLEL